MRNSKIITLYKNKGDRSDCNNCRGQLPISLLSIVGKVFVRVILARLQALADRIYQNVSVASGLGDLQST